MNPDRVQQIVDALGSRLERGVAVDDHMLNLLAVGEDFGDADPARMWTLLHRRTRPEDVDYARLRGATGPVWIEANPELGLAARLCVPVRHEGQLLGFMWLIDRDRSLTGDQIEDARSTAAALGVVLRQRLMIQDRDASFVSYLLEELLSGDLRRSAQAAADLRQHGFVDDDAHVGVLVADSGAPGDHDPTVLAAAVQRASRSVPPGGWLSSVSGRRGTVLIARPRPVKDELLAVAERIRTQLAVGAGSGTGSWWIAVGGGTQGLAGAATSRHQAMVTLSVARRLHATEPSPVLVSWDQLGPYGVIGQLPLDVLDDDSLPVGVFALLRSGSAHLLDTVEKFLDCAGDKQRTAHELEIHRTTLYYRLDRIEAITGMSLADGSDRLLLHLAVKLHRLAPAGDLATDEG